MKNLLLISAFFLCVQSLIGQTSGKIGYLMILERNKHEKENYELIFNGHESVFTIADRERKVKVSDGEFGNSGEEDIMNTLAVSFTMGPDRYIPYVYTDQNKKEILSRDYLIYKGESMCFVSSEESQKINWELSEETKMLGRFQCHMASTSFRGRNYTVWFTYEIPAPFGPWKLHGLPGLILEAYDEEKGAVFLYQSAEIPYNGEIKPTPPDEGRKVSLQEFAEIESNAIIEFTRALESKLPRGAVMKIDKVYPSTAIELSYEF